MTTQEIIVNAIVFVCGWVLKRPALVESVVAKLLKKKENMRLCFLIIRDKSMLLCLINTAMTN